MTDTRQLISRGRTSRFPRAATSLLVAVAAAALIVSAAPAAGRDGPLARVTLVGDSVSDAIPGDSTLTVVDWGAAAVGHGDWFQPDGVHLFGAGAEALAGLLHSTLVVLGVAPKPLVVSTSSLAGAPKHRPYTATLTATGGIAPYRWTCRPGLPPGLHLLAGGKLVGVPRGQLRSTAITFTVSDAVGTTGTARLVVRVR